MTCTSSCETNFFDELDLDTQNIAFSKPHCLVAIDLVDCGFVFVFVTFFSQITKMLHFVH